MCTFAKIKSDVKLNKNDESFKKISRWNGYLWIYDHFRPFRQLAACSFVCRNFCSKWIRYCYKSDVLYSPFGGITDLWDGDRIFQVCHTGEPEQCFFHFDVFLVRNYSSFFVSYTLFSDGFICFSGCAGTQRVFDIIDCHDCYRCYQFHSFCSFKAGKPPYTFRNHQVTEHRNKHRIKPVFSFVLSFFGEKGDACSFFWSSGGDSLYFHILFGRFGGDVPDAVALFSEISFLFLFQVVERDFELFFSDTDCEFGGNGQFAGG